MGVAIVTGSAGLIGSESVRFLARKRFSRIVGIDNDLRRYFFGREASTRWNLRRLKEEVPRYVHHSLDIRNERGMDRILAEYAADILPRGRLHLYIDQQGVW
jgi:CDP-paratose 2-epimerase